MARVTYVKKAQQRYETKPVLDAQGNPVKIALARKDGTPKTTSAKRGSRPIFITKTEADKTRPKPLHTCGKCGKVIEVGQPYKWIKPKSGPYGGRLMVRCGDCPTWQVWDYSSSLNAQVARIEHDANSAVDAAEDEGDVEAALNDAADAIRDLAEQKRDAAQNMEDGFGHATYQSEELAQQAEDLDSWADDVEGTDVDALETFDCQAACSEGRIECPECQGSGTVERQVGEDEDYQDVECDACWGDLDVECEDCDGTGTDLEAARESWSEAVSDALGNCPV